MSGFWCVSVWFCVCVAVRVSVVCVCVSVCEILCVHRCQRVSLCLSESV